VEATPGQLQTYSNILIKIVSSKWINAVGEIIKNEKQKTG
jgi:hypothetical protein